MSESILKNESSKLTSETSGKVDFRNTIETEPHISQNQLWKDVQTEYSRENLKKLSTKPEDYRPVHKEIKYLDENVFPILLPALKNCLLAAKTLNCLKFEKSVFNGVDFIAQLLHNFNPRHPERKKKNENIYQAEWSQDILSKKVPPRPPYPKSHLWKEEEAALVIQAFMRGYFVRREPEIQDLRQFWKSLKKERQDKLDDERAAREEEAIKAKKDSIVKYFD